MKSLSFFTICSLIFLLGGNLRSLHTQPLDGRTIVQKNDQQQKSQDEYTEMTMTLISKTGKKRIRKVVQYQQTDNRGDKKILIRFLSPPDIKGTGLLTLEHHNREDEQWLYLPALRRVRRISAAEKSDNFVGTDFTYQDLKSEDMDQYHYRLTGEESIDSIPCYVVEAIPSTKSERKKSAYGKRIFWISKDHFVLVQVHFFDKKGKLFKILNASEIREIDKTNKWRAWHIEIKNLQNGHRTILKYDHIKINRGVPSRFFSKRYLKRG